MMKGTDAVTAQLHTLLFTFQTSPFKLRSRLTAELEYIDC